MRVFRAREAGRPGEVYHGGMKNRYDVVVLGGGPGGTAAAVAAADQGASVLLVERYGFLGGMATAGLVNPFMVYFIDKRKLTTRVFNELVARLDKEGALDQWGLAFDDEVIKVVLDQMMADHKVDVLLHSSFAGLEMAGGRIARVAVTGKSGRAMIEAPVFVDSTGDGDVAAQAGAPVEVGRRQDGGCQPMTLCFRIGGVKGAEGVGLDRGKLRNELTALYLEAKKSGEVKNPREDILIFSTLVPGVVHFNTTRVVGRSGLDQEELTRAEIEGRRQAYELFKLFKRKDPRFKDSYLLKMGAQIGIRETRRVMGAYSLTEEDVLTARKFEDGIARSNYPVDIHNPAGTGTVMKDVPEGDYYEIPYRCIVPSGTENLLVGSRCISCTHEAHSSLRVMPVVASMGEAAGVAAAWSARMGKKPSELDGKQLKKAVLGD